MSNSRIIIAAFALTISAAAASADDLPPTDENRLSATQFILHSAPNRSPSASVAGSATAVAPPQQTARPDVARDTQWMRRSIILDGGNR